MHDRTHLIELRIDRFLRERLLPARYRASAPLTISAWEAPGEPVPFSQAAAAPYLPFSVGQAWGRAWGTTWFAVRGEVPASWADAEGTRPELVADLGFTAGQSGFQAEALVWRRDGTVVKGVSPFNTGVPGAVVAGSVDVLLEAASNPDVGSLFTFEPTALGDRATAGEERIYRLRRLELGLLDVAVDELIADVTVLRQLVDELDASSPRRAELVEGLDRLVDAVDPHDVAGTAAAGRAVLAPLLASP
ncbi:MAG: alpha-mannosidase, partial [Microbacterium sp.]